MQTAQFCNDHVRICRTMKLNSNIGVKFCDIRFLHRSTKVNCQISVCLLPIDKFRQNPISAYAFSNRQPDNAMQVARLGPSGEILNGSTHLVDVIQD